MNLSKKFWLSVSSFALFGVLAIGATPSYATKFTNQFIEFELPPQWQCNLEGAEWVCQSTDEKKKKDAIIVLAAKIKGPQDSMDQYKAYLMAAKSYTSVQGKPVKSEAKWAQYKVINGQNWVDALHLESEIPGFYTRYFATVKEDIGVLVTYSINKAKYQSYLPDFENMVNTIKVFRKPGGVNAGPQQGDIFKQAAIPPASVDQNVVFGNAPQGGNDNAPQGAKPKQDDNSMLLIGGVVALLAFVIWKRKRQKGS